MQTHQDLFGPRQFTAGLAFRTIGQGPSLILLHGGSGSRNHWIRNVQELANHFQVITLDLPGLGESASPPAGIADDEYIDWVAHAIEQHIGGASFDMAGFSFGGTVTSSITARLAARGRGPRRVSLVSPSGFGIPMNRTVTLEKIKRGPDTSDRELRAATARNLGAWMLSSAPSPDDTTVDLHLDNLARARYDSRPISYRNSTLGDIRAAAVPVQLLFGQADPLVFPSLDERLTLVRDALPDAHVEVLPGGHWLQYEANAAVNRRITDFHSSRSL